MALTAKKVYAILKRQISDMEAKLNSPVRYRGTVATADLLPLNPDIGDMYNIESKSIYGEAGMNVAWNGVVWDTMGAPIDMSLYIKSSELADWAKQPQKPDYTAEEVGALPANTKIPSKTSDLQNDSGFLTKIPDNYLSGTDKTLSASGKAADAKATGDKITELSADISNKLNKNQGSENSGKIAGINESGDIVPMFPVSVDYNEETKCLEFGSDQKMELNKGINLDSTLTKTGYAADAGAVGEITNSLKEDLEGFKGSSFTASEQYSENVLDNDNGVMEGWNAKVPVYLKKNIRYLIGVANSTALNPGVAINIIDESGSLLQVVKQDYTQIPTSNGVPFESTIDGKFYMLFKFIEGGITAWKKFMVIKAPQESVAWAEKDFVPFSYKKTYTANLAEKASQIQSRYYDKTHLSFGDSITEQAVWQSYFRKYLGTKMELIKGYSGQALWKNCSEQSLEEKLGNTQFDFATVMFGTNDWGQSRQIGSNSDTNDNGEYTGTFKGSLNTFFKNMTTKFPSKPFIMVTPPNGFEDLDYNNKPFSDNGRKNLLGLSIKDYADAIKELSAMWGIPCFDFNSVCGWNYINKSIYLKSESNGTYIHPNGVGGQEYAYKLARFCEMN